MTPTNQTERLFQTWLQSEAPQQVPDGLLDRINAATRTTRPRPTWLARLEGHGMDIIQGGRSTGLPRLSLILAVIGLILAAVVAVLVAGSGTRDSSNPTAPLGAVASPGSSGQAGGLVQPVQPGDPLPGDVIGNWYDASSNEYVYYLPAGDPFCVQVWRIVTQGCNAYWDDAIGGLQRYAHIVTFLDGRLRYHSIGQQDCKGQDSQATYERVGDRLNLAVIGGSCFTRLAALVLVGTPTAPASAPPLPIP